MNLCRMRNKKFTRQQFDLIRFRTIASKFLYCAAGGENKFLFVYRDRVN